MNAYFAIYVSCIHVLCKQGVKTSDIVVLFQTPNKANNFFLKLKKIRVHIYQKH